MKIHHETCHRLFVRSARQSAIAACRLARSATGGIWSAKLLEFISQRCFQTGKEKWHPGLPLRGRGRSMALLLPVFAAASIAGLPENLAPSLWHTCQKLHPLHHPSLCHNVDSVQDPLLRVIAYAHPKLEATSREMTNCPQDVD